MGQTPCWVHVSPGWLLILCTLHCSTALFLTWWFRELPLLSLHPGLLGWAPLTSIPFPWTMLAKDAASKLWRDHYFPAALPSMQFKKKIIIFQQPPPPPSVCSHSQKSSYKWTATCSFLAPWQLRLYPWCTDIPGTNESHLTTAYF